MRPRTMYDSVTPGAIPADAEIVAGYVDGRYAWRAEDWAMFPDAVKVRIAVFPTTMDGDVLDCERGDAEPSDCPGWIVARQAAGLAVPTIYCNMSNLAAVKVACEGLTYSLWLAHYTGVPHLEAGSVATQWIDHGPHGENVDISLCAPGWPED